MNKEHLGILLLHASEALLQGHHRMLGLLQGLLVLLRLLLGLLLRQQGVAAAGPPIPEPRGGRLLGSGLLQILQYVPLASAPQLTMLGTQMLNMCTCRGGTA